jgi:hypothetical protein
MPTRSIVALLAAAAVAIPSVAADVRFDVEVMAVLSKAGCNAGACHGNLNGKGGFKLSLRGEDADWDYAALTRHAQGRRVNSLDPESSLLLRKPAGIVSHEGGRRFDVGSHEYAILQRWIADGAARRRDDIPSVVELTADPAECILVEPAASTTIRARARFSNGAIRDVTRLAAFELSNPTIAEVDSAGAIRKLQDGETAVSVRFLQKQATVRLAFVPARPGFRWSGPHSSNYVDRHVFAKLQALRMNPSDLCDDTTFLRRAHLDIIGRLPDVGESRAFLRDSSSDKRARLIDRLLQQPEFADFWALKWSDLLRNEEKTLDRKGVQAFHGWIRKCIADGKPLNEFARELIAGRGSTYAEPAANYYRALRDPFARAEATAQLFLGIRVQCCKCHNHPFDQWTQNDYYQLAAFFPRVQYRIVENNRRDKFDKHEFDGEQIVWFDRISQIKHPRTSDNTVPRFLGGRELTDDADRLQSLADWVAAKDNPFFARTQANRIWFHMFGRGLVDPDDDFRVTNPATHPELLDQLARDFADHQFDLRYLIRTIATSKTYQLSATPNESNRADETNWSHSLVQRIDSEPLLDAIADVLQTPVKFDGHPLGIRAVQLPGVQQRPRGNRAGMGERFMKTFGKPERLLNCDCERSDDTTVLQAFQMLSGEMMTRLLAEPENRLGRLLSGGAKDDAILEEFFLAALCRLPSRAEREHAQTILRRGGDRRTVWEDVVWGILNSKEFLLRR